MYGSQGNEPVVLTRVLLINERLHKYPPSRVRSWIGSSRRPGFVPAYFRHNFPPFPLVSTLPIRLSELSESPCIVIQARVF